MREQQVNVCLVTEGDTLKGILTDRDVLTKVANHPETLDQPIETVMTANPITVGPETSAAQALWLMDQYGFRNLPVVGGDGDPEAASGRVLGVMTHQAVINYLAARYPIEVLNRPSQPDQFPRKREGGD
jgi:CBS domain-containing protein